MSLQSTIASKAAKQINQHVEWLPAKCGAAASTDISCGAANPPCKAVQTSVLSAADPGGAAAPRATRGLLTAAFNLRAASSPTLRSVTCSSMMQQHILVNDNSSPHHNVTELGGIVTSGYFHR
jgi:hypothetical protein